MSDRENMTEFQKRISDLCHAEVRDAIAARDERRLATVIAHLGGCLGTAIAIASGGERDRIVSLLSTIETQIAEVAAKQAPDGRRIFLGLAELGPGRQ